MATKKKLNFAPPQLEQEEEITITPEKLDKLKSFVKTQNLNRFNEDMILNQKEHDRYTKWRNKLQKKYIEDQAHVTYTVEFTPTGIGMHIAASCSKGERIDLTDYSTW